MSLTGKSPSETYKDITYVDNSNSGVDSTVREVKTGNGSATAVSLSDRALKVKSTTNNTTALDVQNSSGTSKLLVDTSNDQVKALGTHVNTQYAYFGMDSQGSANYLADTHHPVPFFSNSAGGVLQDNITFGTGTDPATTFTLSLIHI